MNKSRILLLVLTAVAIFMGWQHYQKQNADDGTLQVAQQGSVVVLFWSGSVRLPMQASLSRAFEEWRGKTKHFVLQLNSPGGSLREGREAIEVIQRIKQSHRFDTFVAPRNICMSMCVPIFLQGETRAAAPDAQFMFHEPRRVDDDGERQDGFAFEHEGLSRRFFERYFTNSPMDEQWRKNLEKQWIGKDIFKSGQELVDERSNIITQLVK